METIRCPDLPGPVDRRLQCQHGRRHALGDSRADHARRSARAIRAWLVERYGPWISYKPTADPILWPLWAAPLLLLGAGGYIVAGRLKTRGKGQRHDGGCSSRWAWACWRPSRSNSGRALPLRDMAAPGAALLLGLAGYAWQGHPGLAGHEVHATTAAKFDERLAEKRRSIGERMGPASKWLIMSDGLALQGDTQDAANIIAKGLETMPDDPDLWVGLGNALLAHGSGRLTPAADTAYRQALALQPDGISPNYFYGLALAQSGQFEPAKQSGRSWPRVCPRSRPARRAGPQPGHARPSHCGTRRWGRRARPRESTVNACCACEGEMLGRPASSWSGFDRESPNDGEGVGIQVTSPEPSSTSPSAEPVAHGREGCSSCPSGRSASSSATSAPARSTPSARPSRAITRSSSTRRISWARSASCSGR